MNAWINDTTATNIPNHDNGAFSNPTVDPSVAFLQQPPNPSDPNQFQKMFNGAARNMSPGFHNPNSVVPSKRPRPDDGYMMSPRQGPGGAPASRSQTPQNVPYPGFQGPTNGATHFAQPQVPTAYQQFQPGSSNPSPSPVPQEFDPQAAQRVQTASPSPFSPAGVQQLGSQISPQSDHGSRVNTPQSANFVQNQPYAQGVPSQYSPSPAGTSSGLHPSLQAQYAQANPNMIQGFPPQQAQSRQQQIYQMHLQNQARQQLHAAASQAPVNQPGGQPVNPMTNPQIAAMRQMQQAMTKPATPEAFLRTLQKFMMSRRLPLDTNPIVSGRSIILTQLYAIVMKHGGCKKVTATNSWPIVAQQLQFPAMQYPTAPQEIRDHYFRNLAPYEQAWLTSHQKQSNEQIQNSQHQIGEPQGMPAQMSPTKIMHNQSFDPSQQYPPTHPAMQQPQAGGHQGPVNGFSTPPPAKPQLKQQPHMHPQQHPNQHQHRSSLSHGGGSLSPNGNLAGFSPSSSIPGDKNLGSAPPSVKKQFGADHVSDFKYQNAIEDEFKPAVLPESNYHGPVILDEILQLGDEIIRLKPNVPSFAELGVIDIHALTMSIKSGIHAEVRVALDTLTEISFEPGVQISLDNCDDLVEALVDCAEEQVDFLAENAVEVSDVMLLPSYEELIRGCRLEIESLVDVPEFGSLEYELERAVDRLICITTIIRNFSFAESNFNLLSMPFVVKFMSTVIRYLGTRNMLLRTNQNTLDFMKDAVIYLSNLAHTIHLPGKEEALSLLHFLLSFSPTPPPTLGSDRIVFPPYNPSIHKYLPSAVDSLAKLLARDDPNRTYYKVILTQDTSFPPYDLLTRTFALAIAPVPEYMKGNVLAITEARKPFLMQGMLAAEILSGYADSHVARAWLGSSDGFAVSLLHLASLLSADRQPQVPQRHTQAAMRAAEADYHGYNSIIFRMLSVLSRLGEMAKGPDGTLGVPFNVFPKKENVLGALVTRNIDPNTLRLLCEYAGLAV